MSAAACLINAAFGWFVLPESLPPERRMAFAWKRANPLGSLRLLRSHRQLLGLAAIDFLVNVAHQVLPAIFVLYAGYRYGWGETTVGLTLAFVGICTGPRPGPAGRPGRGVARHAARPDGRPAVRRLGMAIYGLAPTGAWFWLGVPVMALWGIVGPVAPWTDEPAGRAQSEQGQLQGANSSLAQPRRR